MGNQDERKWQTVEGKEGIWYREHATRKHGKRKDRFLAIRYRNGAGKRLVETLGWVSDGWTVDKAVSLLREVKENIRTGKLPQSVKEMRAMAEAARIEADHMASRVKLQSITFGELAELYKVWVKEHRVDSSNVEQLLEMHILPVLGAQVAKDITSVNVNALRNIVAAKAPLTGRNKNVPGACLSPQTVLHILKTVREVFNFALETPAPSTPGTMLFTGHNPAILSRRGRGVRIPKNDARRLRILNDEEISALLSYGGRREEAFAELHDMMLLSLDVGPRAGELVHIKRESCDPITGAVRIYKGSRAHDSTKGGVSRIVHVGQLYPEALAMLRRRLSEADAGTYLFPGIGGAARDPNGLNRAMRRIMQTLRFNDGVIDPRNLVVWHTLRHTYATKMLESGIDIYMLKELMGHASVTTTEIYLHLCDRSRRERALACIALGRRND